MMQDHEFLLSIDHIQSKFKLIFHSTHSRILTNENLLVIAQNNPKEFYALLQNKCIVFQNLEKDAQTKLFYYTCSMLKEIDREKKIIGLKILSIITEFISQEFLLNAFIFDNKIAKAFLINPRKKFVSIGDYEIAKIDDNAMMNYGFFASVLEEEKKEIKIEALKLISQIGNKELYKQFADKSFRYIIELINDEEDEVRFASIECLEKLVENLDKIDVRIKIKFKNSSSEIIYFNLKEKSFKLRKKLYRLISKIPRENLEEFQKTMKNLKENIKLFPEDKIVIFQCIKACTMDNYHFLNEEFFRELFSIDINYLISEYKWEDDLYIADLIILQEYLKGNKYRVSLTIPKFFIKHYGYLADKYSSIFEQLTASLIEQFPSNDNNILTSNLDTRKISENYMANNNNTLICNFDDISEIFQNYQTRRHSELYNLILSFLTFISHCSENISDNFSILWKIDQVFLMANSIIDILELMNLKIRLENNSQDLILFTFNKFFCEILLDELSKTFAGKSCRNQTSKHFKEFLKSRNIIQPELDNIIVNQNYCEQIMLYLIDNHQSFLNDRLISLRVTNPKNFFLYIHSKEQKNYPFFLQISIKVNNAYPKTESEMFLIKNLLIFISHATSMQRVDIDPSDISFNEKQISIDTKACVYLDLYQNGLDEESYSLAVGLESDMKSEFILFLKGFDLDVGMNKELIILTEEIHFNITC